MKRSENDPDVFIASLPGGAREDMAAAVESHGVGPSLARDITLIAGGR